MTSEEWKERLPLIQAYLRGETIQYYTKNNEWCDIKDPKFTADLTKYRIKPKDKYRPFKNGEECFNEIMNHHPFGWVKNKKNSIYNLITRIEGSGIYFGFEDFSFDQIYLKHSFADGTPFGIKEDI